MKISQKLLILFLLNALIPVLAVAGFSYFNTQRALQEQINLGINNAANRQANRIHTAYEESMAKLQVFPTSIAVNRAMAAYLATPNKANQDVLNETLDDTHRFDTAYSQLNVLIPEGVVIGSTNPPMLGKSFADTTVFERGRDTMDASVFFKDSGNRLAYYSLGPIRWGGQ